MKPWDIIDENELRELRVSGSTVPELAEHFGVPMRWITYRCKDLSIAAAPGISGGNSGRQDDWQLKAAESSAALLSAIMRVHPERIAA